MTLFTDRDTPVHMEVDLQNHVDISELWVIEASFCCSLKQRQPWWAGTLNQEEIVLALLVLHFRDILTCDYTVLSSQPQLDA